MRRWVLLILAALCLTVRAVAFFLFRAQSTSGDVALPTLMVLPSLTPTGMPMPTRFRFYYDTARSSHYHDIQVTWFNRTFMRIHERNLEGHITLDLSLLGKAEDLPKTSRAGIQGY